MKSPAMMKLAIQHDAIKKFRDLLVKRWKKERKMNVLEFRVFLADALADVLEDLLGGQDDRTD